MGIVYAGEGEGRTRATAAQFVSAFLRMCPGKGQEPQDSPGGGLLDSLPFWDCGKSRAGMQSIVLPAGLGRRE